MKRTLLASLLLSTLFLSACNATPAPEVIDLNSDVTRRVDSGMNSQLQTNPQTDPQTNSQTTQGETMADYRGDITELKIEDTKVGTGDEVKAGDTVLVHYTGMLVDGTVFDTSKRRGEPIRFAIGVGQVIEGWDQGIVGMKEGGTRKLSIPPEMGYGARGAGASIPPNASLIFEVELIEIQ